MKWASAVSDRPSLADAVAECAARLQEELGGLETDLLVAFPSAHHAAEYSRVPQLVRQHVSTGLLVGCSGGGVIGAGREIEHRPGFALAAAHLPNVRLVPLRIEDAALPDEDAAPERWEGLLGVEASQSPHFLLLADPFSIRGESLLSGLDYAFPRSVKIGGLASGAQQPGGNALYLDSEVFRAGAVGVAFYGDIEVDTIVAQGCRPIGKPMQVTACHRNLLLELDGQTPFEALKEVFEGLSERDRQLAQHSLFLGVVMDEFKDNPQLGDFLIRNIIGVDPQRGILAIGELLREGQTVQFHLRDALTSSQDLDAMLNRYVEAHPKHQEAGALLFSCLGRGSYLYGRPDHDTEMFRQKVGELPLTGFFCNGEIGPVGGMTFLHGYTSSFGIFHSRRGE